MSSCQLDLSSLAKEQTHHLELPLEESRGFVVLLVTLTASAHVSIADLSVTPLDDPQERQEMLKNYVSTSSTPWMRASKRPAAVDAKDLNKTKRRFYILLGGLKASPISR